MANKAVFIVLIMGLLLSIDCVSSAVRVERQLRMPGNYTPVSVNDRTVKQMAVLASSVIGGSKIYGIVYLSKILQAWIEIVDGIKFKLKLELKGVITNINLTCDSVVLYMPSSSYGRSVSNCTVNK